ncbi:MAG TPA: hypothetical protein VLB90_08315 [Pseudomonadales bacterium]|nr:hypothetical protein [Pseudomonadales bacterium]
MKNFPHFAARFILPMFLLMSGVAAYAIDTDGDNLDDSDDPLPNNANILNNYLDSIAGDKLGTVVAFAGDVDNDGYGDYVIGIPGYDVPSLENPAIIKKDAGRAVVISGKNGDELMSVNGTAAGDAMGSSVAGGGDYDGDGYNDVIVGSPKKDALDIGTMKFSLKDAGAIRILCGPDGGAQYGRYGEHSGDLFGSSVALADVDGDGLVDIIAGAPKADDLRNPSKKIIDAGSVLVAPYDFAAFADQVFYGGSAKAYAGVAVAAGDVDHDGDADIIIGAPNDDDLANKHPDAGSISVYSIEDNINPVMKKYGEVSKAYLGKSVASGDVNKDDAADVLAGAPGDDSGSLKDTGSITVFSGVDGAQLTKKSGALAKAGLGNSVATGDVNDDGYADIIAGAALDDNSTLQKVMLDTGSVSVWSGNGYGWLNTSYGAASKDSFGASVAAGDINGDGKDDLIVGIPGKDAPATKIIKDAGAVQVISAASF